MFRVPGRELKNLTNERIDSKAKNLLLEKRFWRIFFEFENEIPRRHSSTSMSTLMASSWCWSGVSVSTPSSWTRFIKHYYRWNVHRKPMIQFQNNIYIHLFLHSKSHYSRQLLLPTKSMDSFRECVWNLPRFLLPIPSPTLSFESGNPCSTIDTSPNGSTYRKLIEPELMGVDQHIHGTPVLGCPRKLVNG